MKICKYRVLSPMTYHGVTYQNEYCNKKENACLGDCPEAEMVEAHYRAVNIEWDTDDDDIDTENLDLPTEVDIPDEVVAEQEDYEDAISDWLSDEYGFCHYGYELTIVAEET